jgi:competence protein ComEA
VPEVPSDDTAVAGRRLRRIFGAVGPRADDVTRRRSDASVGPEPGLSAAPPLPADAAGVASGAVGVVSGAAGVMSGAGAVGSGAAARPRRLGGSGPFDPGRRGVRALAVVAALVILAAAFLAWRARPRVEPVPAPLDGAATEAGRTAAPGGSPPTPGAEAEIVVAVTGKVRRPGLVRLPGGARVADAITAAGGALPGADVSFLNLARKVTDGELIVVGVPVPPGVGESSGSAGPGGSGPPGPAGQPGGRVNLNTATLAQLDSLPGVGPVLAQRIIDHRERNGAFRAVTDLREVDGIGATRFEQLKDLVTV